ncbi:TerB family tellurite resistance protein [Aquimarina agarilytica]|uniref:TerB family tellurite resistance protein n=1 Tax=Aquimarina agarilytica TaxID=1087449 RepID=UPI0002884AA1|nr:TerB family tellurite resistance protein [Aquimarina agarilytica]
MDYTREEKLSLLSEMIELAKSDNKLKKSEVEFIELVATSLNLERKEVGELIARPVKRLVLASEFERIVQFYRLLLVINVDEQVSLKEVKAIKNLGLRMGLPSQAIDEVFQQMENYENRIIPTNSLMKIFKKFHN